MVHENCFLLSYYTAIVVIPYGRFGTTHRNHLQLQQHSYQSTELLGNIIYRLI